MLYCCCPVNSDFRQILPVIPCATCVDEINARIKQSHLWRNVNTLSINTNIRVQLQNDPLALSFSEQLLKIGNGTIPLYGNHNTSNCQTISATW